MFLVVGFDPGKTSALSLIDILLNKVVFISSFNEKNLKFIIRKITNYGIPLFVGYDKNKACKKIDVLARKLNLIKVYPKEDLKISKKRKIVREFLQNNNNICLNNKHEFDSLAIAIYTFKKIKPILNKILTRKGTITAEDLRIVAIKLSSNGRKRIRL